jgi:hypothetical protein
MWQNPTKSRQPPQIDRQHCQQKVTEV